MSDSTQTPGAASGAPRPTGKRQLAGQATTARATSITPTPKKTESRSNPVEWMGGVVSEMSKVIWPTGKEMVQYTAIVLVFLVVLTTLVAVVDWLTRSGLQQLFTIGS